MSETLNSVCTLDCPDTCSLSVNVENGKITQIRGSHANPYTHGAICTKVTRYQELVHSKDRLLNPLKRVGAKGENRFEAISWEEALDTIFERFSDSIEKHGPETIAPLNYAGPHGMLAGGSMDMRFFNRLGASQLLRGSFCGGVRAEAFKGTYGKTVPMRPEHIAQAKLVIIWGINVSVSNLHLMRMINHAKADGAKVVVIDPCRTKVAEQAHLWLPVMPGTDVLLAWALASELEAQGGLDKAFMKDHVLGSEAFMECARGYPVDKASEICGVPAEDIRKLASWYKELSPAAIAVGAALERNLNGGSGLHAIMALPALAGKFGVQGGGLLCASSNAFPKTPARLQGAHLLPPNTRMLNLGDMGHHLLDENLSPPITGLFVYNHNPVIVHPDQQTMIRALSREDLFTVVCDLVWTDTVPYADIVLPAASSFEHGDLYAAYGQQFLQRAEAVLPPPGEALPNTEIFRRLAARFGFDDPEFLDDDTALMDQALDESHPNLEGHKPSQIPVDKALSMTFEGQEAVLFKTTFPGTKSQKVELDSSYLEKAYSHPLPTFRTLDSVFPLTLISPSSDDRITSSLGGLPYSDKTWMEMNPQDAKKRNLENGDTVKVWNDQGEIFLTLKITENVRPGVLCSPKGAWRRTSPNGLTVAALVPTHHADIISGACYNDTRVEVASSN